jgi:hypothetical protein
MKLHDYSREKKIFLVLYIRMRTKQHHVSPREITQTELGRDSNVESTITDFSPDSSSGGTSEESSEDEYAFFDEDDFYGMTDSWSAFSDKVPDASVSHSLYLDMVREMRHDMMRWMNFHPHHVSNRRSLGDERYRSFREAFQHDAQFEIMMTQMSHFERMACPPPLSSMFPPEILLDHIPISRVATDEEANSLGSCPVCLIGYRKQMQVRRLPGCGHLVHKPCFDRWIYGSSRYSCPLDNTDIRICSDHCRQLRLSVRRSRRFRGRIPSEGR